MGFFRELLSNDSSERDLRMLVLIKQNKLLDIENCVSCMTLCTQFSNG